MKPEGFLKTLETRTGITPLNFSSDGVLSFVFNDLYTTHIERSKDDHTVTIYGVIGQIPTEHSDLCLRSLLNANLFGRETAGSSFGIDPEKNEIILFRIFELEGLKPDHFFDALREFSLTQEHWTKNLESKAYETSSEIVKEKSGNISQFGSNFLKL